jgi:hypothetical protein
MIETRLYNANDRLFNRLVDMPKGGFLKCISIKTIINDNCYFLFSRGFEMDNITSNATHENIYRGSASNRQITIRKTVYKHRSVLRFLLRF